MSQKKIVRFKNVYINDLPKIHINPPKKKMLIIPKNIPFLIKLRVKFDIGKNAVIKKFDIPIPINISKIQNILLNKLSHVNIEFIISKVIIGKRNIFLNKNVI